MSGDCILLSVGSLILDLRVEWLMTWVLRHSLDMVKLSRL